MNRDDALARYGQIAHAAVWETPKQEIRGTHEVQAVIRRINDIAVGRELLARLADAGLMVVPIPTRE